MSYPIGNLLTKTLEEISLEFTRVTPHETALDFADNDLHHLPEGKLGAILALIPSHICHLSLARTNLNLCNVSQLATDLASIPAHIKSLDLSGNELFMKSVKELKRIFRALPKNIHTLDLAFNARIGKTMNDIILILSFINHGVTRLKMGFNSLAYCSLDDLIRLMANIPFHITSFDLSKNEFDRTTTSDLLAVFSSLSEQVEELTISIEDLQGRSKSDLIKLGTALNYVTKLHILDGHDNPAGNLSAVAVLKSHIGSGLIQQYKEIQKLDKLPWELRRLVLEYSNVRMAANIESFLERRDTLYALNSAAWRNYLVTAATGTFVLATASLWWPYVPGPLVTLALPASAISLCAGGYGLFTSPLSSLKKPESQNERRLVV